MTYLSEERFWLEVAKCQLLCRRCHQDKTLADNGQKRTNTTHGERRCYLGGCRCALCKAANSAHSRRFRLKRKHPPQAAAGAL
jgi:hypothetical protein